MMTLRSGVGAALLWLTLTVPVAGQQHFPRVYGPTGHTYGPTQAHYQYQRQYGQPWHGYGGISVQESSRTQNAVIYGGAVAPLYVAPSYWGGAGYYPYPFWGGPAFAPYGGVVGLNFYAPGVYGTYGVYGTPGVILAAPHHGVAGQGVAQPLAEAWNEQQQRWQGDLPEFKPDPIERLPQASTPEAKLRALKYEHLGDEHLRKQEPLQAYVDYKKAVQAAEDRAEAHFRLGVALVSLQHHASAAFEFKRALFLDPRLPQTGPSLATLMGPDSLMARNALLHKLVEHVSQDIRDPERLFVLGVILHFNDDQRARDVFEAAYRLAGRGNHLLAFLKSPPEKPPAAPPPAQPGQVPLPPLPAAPAPELPPPAGPQANALRLPLRNP